MIYIGTYGQGMTVHPLEQVFYKPIWIQAGHPTDDGQLLSEAYLNETLTYMQWAVERRRLELNPKRVNYVLLI